MKTVLGLLLIVVLLLGGGLGFWYWQEHKDAAVSFRTAVVERGDVWATISATGSVQPEEQVDVGAQVVGQIRSLGRDPKDNTRFVDFCSVVEKGTVLAQLDDTLYKARVAQSRANLKRANGEEELAKAKLLQTERDWERARRAGPQGAVSGLTLDLLQSNYDAAKAAQIVSSANVDQARETLAEAEANLGYTTIRSPVNGTIIQRKVNVGQTVVASLNAPSMFIIATDLTKMQVWAAVNEADVGSIYLGQPVRFVVDSWPNEVFNGKVFQIRLNASITQNVVIYTVVVVTDNSHGKLMPNQTANLQFDVSQRSNVLQVPNSALRWRPQMQIVAPDAREVYQKILKRKAATPLSRNSVSEEDRQTGYVWVQDGSQVRPIKVRVGITDGTVTEITDGDLEEGMEVITGETTQNGNDQSASPFTPQYGNKKQEK